jgi:hypothetical protein
MPVESALKPAAPDKQSTVGELSDSPPR